MRSVAKVFQLWVESKRRKREAKRWEVKRGVFECLVDVDGGSSTGIWPVGLLFLGCH